jgi:hypothetical protein
VSREYFPSTSSPNVTPVPHDRPGRLLIGRSLTNHPFIIFRIRFRSNPSRHLVLGTLTDFIKKLAVKFGAVSNKNGEKSISTFGRSVRRTGRRPDR